HDEAWFENIAYIRQHPYIIPTYIYDNIRFYKQNACRASIQIVIEEIDMTDFDKELPLGMDEVIGESGRSVSGGQEQRIAMSRALLSDKPNILLDEPTAHLDIETEYDIKHVILELFKDKLMVIATHRLHWMQDLDYI